MPLCASLPMEVATSIRQAEGEVGQATQCMDEGAQAAHRTAQAMADILETSNRLFQAVRVIQEIARQTNPLSFNAPIEAGKAGAMGKGFAVLAVEVRMHEPTDCTRAMVKLVQASSTETRQNASASAEDLAPVAENLAAMVASFKP